MEKPLEGMTIAVLAANLFEDIELYYPLWRFKEAGATMILGILEYIGEAEFAQRGTYHPYPHSPGLPLRGRVGMPAPPFEFSFKGSICDWRPISEIRANELDALVIPGGYSPDYLRVDKVTLKLVHEVHAQGKIVAAICHGPWVLMSAGLLTGKKGACVFHIIDDLRAVGGTYVDEPVVREGNIITSRVPDDLIYFCPAIIEALVEQKERMGLAVARR